MPFMVVRPMNILVLYAHPVETSFNAALHRTIVERLTVAGHSVDDCDLYAEDFDPRMSRAERLAYHGEHAVGEGVRRYVDRLRRADALVLSFPVWNFGYPAILKGFFDRVFLPGVSFKMIDGEAVTSLHNIRKVAAITTYGGSRFRALLVGDPPRKTVTRLLRSTIKPFAPVSYLAHYSMNRSTDRSREAFMMKVAERMDRF
jgi:putative NADPH-quinone reductase